MSQMTKIAKMLIFMFFLDIIAIIIIRGWYLMLIQLFSYMGMPEVIQKIIISTIFIIIFSAAIGFLAHEIKIAPYENESDDTKD